ncbi:DUF1624 domain-containing protein [bacterium]|nr:MAG: DUF1624 domain-containing protein [bacterium]
MSSIMASLPKGRMLSLDVFRGITITMMIFVNNPGSWSYMYAPLKHAEWNGWTPTDFIFPFFVFIMGVSIVLAFQKKLEHNTPKSELYKSIFNRTWKLFGLGLFLNLFSINLLMPEHHWFNDTFLNVRYMGVLQRLALVYAITAILYLHFKPKQLFYIGVGTLVFYWLMMNYFPFSAQIDGEQVDLTGSLEHGKNLAAYIDFHVFGTNHVYFKNLPLPYDPEGLFSTFTAVVSCIAGVLTGYYLSNSEKLEVKISTLFFWGVLLLVIGEIMDYGFPINKTIWTPSYVIFMSGMALLFLAMCMFLVDLKGIKNWSALFIVFGSNAIAFFMLSGLFGRLILMPQINGMRLKSWIFDTVFAPYFGNYIGSIAFSVVFMSILYSVMYWLYKKKIFWKV